MEIEVNSKETGTTKVPASATDASESDRVMENEDEESGMKHKKIRKRKKALHGAIRAQMEFYFSDANVSKDRFMQNALKDGPELPLEVFMNFNKLRSICDDLKEVVKALKYSTILKLSDDETKVSRLTPFGQRSQEEIDQCTIYTENLPPNATIEWITKVFTKFGSVAYVSLPKFKDGSRIKGFAFVEFSLAECAAKAVEAYSRSGASYSVSLSEDPGQLCSIQAFNAESLQEMTNKTESKGCETIDKKPIAEGEDDEAPQSKRRKLEEEEEEEEEEQKEEEEEKEEKEEKEKEKEKEKAKKTEETESTAEATQEEMASDEAIKNQQSGKNDENKPSILKMKKRRRNKDINKGELDEETQILSLQVMSKNEWKKLRNKYLNMQRKCYRQVRNQSNPRWQQKQQHQRNEPSNHHLNKPESVCVSEEKQPNVASADFQAGVIVKIVLDQPISDAKRFKEQVKSQEGVTYVEAQDCKLEAFVRCSDAEAAKTLVGKQIWTQSDILQGDEEQDYWRKIEENRLMKRDKGNLRGQKKSGAEKARQKKLAVDRVIDADNPTYPTRVRGPRHKNLHIRFDDDDDDD